MRPTPLLSAGAVVALVGLVLLVVETSRVLGDNTLGGVATALLWVGLGLMAAGGLALVLAVAAAERGLDRREPADG